jgi:uncharacterized protein (DUF4415 family)
MTARKRKSRTDLARVDAHQITADEYAEMPEWTDDQIERAEFAIAGRMIRPANGTLAKRGRPRSETPKQSVHLRLSPDVLAHFRKTGPGWQTRIDQVLRKVARLPARNN